MENKICVWFLTVTGSGVDLLRFDREFDQNGAGYSIDNLYPTPAGLNDNDAYSWRNSNWGTPWDIHKCFVSKQGDRFEYVIKTLWEAPQGSVLEVSKRYPRLCFDMSYGTYIDECKTTIENGEAVRVE